MIYSACKFNKQGDNIQPWCTPFPILNQFIVLCLVLTVTSWPTYRFLRRWVGWLGILISLRIFHSFLWSTQRLKHSQWSRSRYFSGIPLIFLWSINVGNLISGSCAVSKSNLLIWKFLVHHVWLKSSLGDFEHYIASMRNEHSCAAVGTFFGISLLWGWNENWPFPVLLPLLSFPNLLAYWCNTFTSSALRMLSSSAGISSPPLALLVVMLSRAHLTSHSRMSGSRWVVTLSWLYRSLRPFFIQFLCVFLPPLLNIFFFC